ncbi:hypothetical protein [Bacillus salipaludis]|uniref:Lipoprotein n=1 Tax=Bacillus salipaludis TaxID=2547811 RepID=A0ABW8RBS1_9BACI
MKKLLLVLLTSLLGTVLFGCNFPEDAQNHSEKNALENSARQQQKFIIRDSWKSNKKSGGY